MKKTLLFFGVAAAVVFAASCKQNNNGAAEAAPAQDSTAVAGSIVYFNMDKVMQGYDMANDLNSVFETKTGGILSTPVVCGDARLDITDDLLAGLNAAYIKTKETTKK